MSSARDMLGMSEEQAKVPQPSHPPLFSTSLFSSPYSPACSTRSLTMPHPAAQKGQNEEEQSEVQRAPRAAGPADRVEPGAYKLSAENGDKGNGVEGGELSLQIERGSIDS
jgi:hypothetical protein